MIGGDEWHYYIDEFGGTRRDHTVIQFVDHLGEPIEDLEFQLSDEDGNVLSRGMTDAEGAALFLSSNIDFPLLWVKKLGVDEFKPLIRIENNFVRSITFISPKILKEIELFEETEEVGDYRRSNYSE